MSLGRICAQKQERLKFSRCSWNLLLGVASLLKSANPLAMSAPLKSASLSWAKCVCCFLMWIFQLPERTTRLNAALMERSDQCLSALFHAGSEFRSESCCQGPPELRTGNMSEGTRRLTGVEETSWGFKWMKNYNASKNNSVICQKKGNLLQRGNRISDYRDKIPCFLRGFVWWDEVWRY